MKTAAITLIALSLAAASAATAAERFSDVDYLKASRCKGIAEGIGGVDTASVSKMLSKESLTRQSYIQQKGQEEEARARRDAKRDVMKPQLTAELTSNCAAYLGASTNVATTKANTPT